MKEVKELGKLLRKNKQETEHNTRRFTENFPQPERTVDSVSDVFSFKKEFWTSGHPHSVSLNLGFGEQQKPCNLNKIEEYLACQARCPRQPPVDIYGDHPPPDGLEHALVFASFDSNVSGFQLNPAGGIILPLDGIYNVRIVMDFASVTVSGNEWISLSIRRNGYIITQQVRVTSCGLCAFFPHFDFSATGIYCNAGDTIAPWAGASAGLPFYTVSNLCGIFGDSFMIIELVAQP